MKAAAALAAELDRTLERHGLPTTLKAPLMALLTLVTEDPLAPTAIRDPRQALHDHLADSLVALELPAVRDAITIADLGAGAGFPGLPLALARPTSDVTLVESASRKAKFLARATAATGAGNVRVVAERLESWQDGRGRLQLVTARALGPLPVVAEYAAPLLAPGGALLAWRGRRDLDEEQAAARAAAELGLTPGPVIVSRPYPDARNRHLQLFTKTGITPDRFPRRPGVARRRPLGV